MTLAELLNTDVETVGQWLGDGLRWWWRELAGMAPAGWVETRPSLVAEPLPEGGYRFSRQGRHVMDAGARGGRPRRVSLVLPADTSVLRAVPAPALPDRDVRRMLALDIDRLTPFRADQVFVSVAPGAGGSGVAQVAAVPRERAVQAVEDARAHGLDPRALGLVGADPAVDFLPAMREARAIARGRADRRLVWIVLAGLLTLNLAVAIGRDIWQVQALQNQLSAQQPAVDRVQAVRRRVMQEEARRADILTRRAAGEPLRMLDSVTGAIPNGAWVDRLVFDGQSVRVSGYRQDQVDVAKGLRDAALLTNIRNADAEAMTRQAAGQPFDITADLKTARGR